MNDLDLSYIAGFIDADGCISFNSCKAKTFHGKSHSPRISGFSIDRHVLDFIQAAFGGGINASQGKSSLKRIHYRWSLSGDNAVACVRKLLPFLRIKKEQAKLLCRFDDERLFHKRGNKKNKIPIEEFLRREDLAVRSKYLNQRGYLEARPH